MPSLRCCAGTIPYSRPAKYGSGQVSPRELKSGNYPGAAQGEVVGQTGLEAQYDQYLRGRDGKQQVEIDAQGIPTGIVKTKQPVPGHNLQTSLDKIGFRPHQGDPQSFLRSLRRAIARAPLEKRDCNVLHRICQQIDFYVDEHPRK